MAQITLTGRRVLIGFDGDLRRQLAGLAAGRAADPPAHRGRRAPGRAGPDGARAGRTPTPVGADDYLAAVGDFRSLLDRALPALPPAPDRGEPEPAAGDWRINDTTRCAEEFVITRAHRAAADWEPRTRLAGRVGAVLTRRSVSDREADTGELDPAAQAMADTVVRVDVDWFDPDTGRAHHAQVTGPVALLADDPRDWHREPHRGNIPADLLRHPDWPRNGPGCRR